MQHGWQRYRSNAKGVTCGCEICRTGHAIKRAEERAAGRQPMNSGGFSGQIHLDGDVVQLPPAVYRTLMAFVHDGPDNETLARRVGVSSNTAKRRLSAIQSALELPTRTALALAVERGDVRVQSTEHGEKPSEPARSRKGA